MKGVIIAIVIVVALGGGGYGGYVMGYSGGEEAGYNTGYSAGQEAGYSQGHEEGYDEGSTAGYDEGKDAGYTEGYEVGKDDGYTEGHHKGYLSGKQDGRAEGYSSGKTEGYAEGLADGKQEGYDEGHTTGYDEGYDEGLAVGGAGYTIRDPTYAEVIVFLLNDTTDSNEYIEGVYECQHFVRDICDNAEAEGFRCAYVSLRYPAQGHAIVAFNTSDRGLVYFDPQVDARVEPVVGKKYHECVEGHPFSPPPIDDTIMDILVIW